MIQISISLCYVTRGVTQHIMCAPLSESAYCAPLLKQHVSCAPLSETPGDTYEGTLATA